MDAFIEAFAMMMIALVQAMILAVQAAAILGAIFLEFLFVLITAGYSVAQERRKERQTELAESLKEKRSQSTNPYAVAAVAILLAVGFLIGGYFFYQHFMNQRRIEQTRTQVEDVAETIKEDLKDAKNRYPNPAISTS